MSFFDSPELFPENHVLFGSNSYSYFATRVEQ